LYAAGGTRLMLGPGKPLALLTYLALTAGRRTSRELLMDLLWADLAPERARSALRQALFHLRRLLGEDALPGTEELSLARPMDADRDRFLAAINQGDLEGALATYTGEFLPAFGVPGGAAFEQWADLERTRLRAAFLRSADLVVRRQLNQSRFREAQRLARRVRDELPEAEAAWRLLLETVVAGRDFVSAVVEAEAIEQWATREGILLEPATRLAIERARQVVRPESDAPGETTLMPELTGREREFSAITTAWEAARTGPARHLHLSAPAGLGKTRLLHDAVARLAAAGARVVQLRGAPGDRDIPYALAGDLAGAIGTLPGGAGVAPASAAALLALNPSLSSHLAGTPDSTGGEDALRRRVQALSDLVHAVAHEQAFVLVIDDLHWVDPLSYRVFEGLFGRLNGARVLCLTAGRPDRIPVSNAITMLPLAPLAPSQVSSLVLALGAIPETQPWGRDFIAGLHRATGGSPLLVLETLRLALDEGMLSLERAEWRCLDEGRLASLLQAGKALLQRIRALPPEEGWVLALLATAGTPIAAPAFVAGHSGALSALERQGLATRSVAGWLPAHDEIAAAAREALPAERQAAADRAIGQLLIDTPAPDTQGYFRGLRHFVAAGDEALVRRHFPQYAKRARQQRDHRPFAELAAELLGDEAGSPRVTALTRELPVSWRVGLWSPARQWTAVAALAVIVTVATAVALRRGGQEAALQRLVYVDSTQASQVTAIRPEQFDGRNTPLVLTSGPSTMANIALAYSERPPAVSPDGRSVAWTADSGDSTTLDIWLRTPAGTRRLTRQLRDDVVSSWLPDGSGLVGMSNRWSSPTVGGYDIAVFDTATGAARQITGGPDHDGAPFVSPDGTRVAFTRESTDGPFRMCVTDFHGLEPPDCRLPAGRHPAQLVGWSGPAELVLTLDSADTRPLVRYDWQRGEVTALMGPHVYRAQLSPDRRWVLAAVRLAGVRGFRDWVIPVDRPGRARQVGRTGDTIPLVRWWEGVADESGLIDRIEFADTTRTILPGVATRVGVRALTVAGTEVPILTPVRWRSSDTAVATIDGLGDVRPRTVGTVTIEASLAGWRTVSKRVEVTGAPATTAFEESWDPRWTERWIIFGDPQPEVTTGPGMVPGFWNRGDGTFQSMGILRPTFSAAHGLGVEVRLSTPATKDNWQRARTSLVAGIDTAAFPSADQQKAPPHLGRPDAFCGASYPGGAGRYGQGRIAVNAGTSSLVDLGPTADLLRSGAWWTLRLQILPDGRCGIAINGQVVWLSPESIPLDGEFRLRLGDESAGTRLLHGPLQVWTGVRTDIDWSTQPR
ncbi:MAG: transcriptional regulator protein, partial [Gemmatimonadetes bacterium]|nr:transcriptional regulator protein [Gemmatimonadota bacterium]